MFILKFIFLNFFLIHLNLIETDGDEVIETNKECLIHSFEYKREYLFTSDDPVWPQNQKNYNIKRNLFTYPLRKVNDYDKITWYFVPVVSSNQRTDRKNKTNYLIKSSKFENEYICATNEHEIFSQSRRIIIRLKLMSSMLKTHSNCHWRIESQKIPKLNRSISTFTNVLFNDESFYAASSFFSIGWFKRSVYLWSERTDLKSKQFKWLIDCSKGEYLVS